MKEKVFSTKVLAEVAIFAALTFVLDVLQGGIWRGVWINGGSFGFAMIPVIIIAYRRGLGAGLLCGLAASLLQLLSGLSISPTALESGWFNAFLQILLDYVLTYPAVACAGVFAGLFKNSFSKNKRELWLCLGCVLGGLLKFLCHFLAGVIFWGNIGSSFAGISDSNAMLYSFIYNGSYMLPNIVLTTVLVLLIDLKQPKILSINNLTKEAKEDAINA